MNKLIISTVAISVGLWTQFVMADYSDIGRPMTSEEFAYQYANCTEGFVVGGCVNPVALSAYDGYTPADCNEWMSTFSCTKCKKGYKLTPYTCIPNNEQGIFYPGCMPNMMTDEEKVDILFAYTCECGTDFSATGFDGVLFRGCNTSSIEYQCDTNNKYYQSSSTIKCTVKTDSDGDFNFSRCTGCKECKEDTQYWKKYGDGYERAYHGQFVIGTDGPQCNDVYDNNWRCAANYYGTSTNGTSGCSPCPSLESQGLSPVCNDGGGCPYVKSDPGSTQITQCYAGTWEPDLKVYLIDSTGTFHWWPPDDLVNTYGECYYK